MIAVNIVGFKDTGKTTLAVELVRKLVEMGCKVGAAKLTHLKSLDKEDTDSDRLLEACGEVAALASGESAMFWREKKYLPDMLGLFSAEVLVVEGGKELGWLPRILLLKEEGDARKLQETGCLALCSFGPLKAEGLRSVEDVGELAKLVMEKGFALPGLDCGACGRENCAGLAREIVAGTACAQDCAAVGGKLSVEIGGRAMPLNPFVERMLGSGIKAMLAELKGYGPGAISIKIEA